MKKVGIYTTFYEAASGYSLINVAETQIRMLLDHGYDPAVFVQENFEQPEGDTLWRPESVDLRRSVPQMRLGLGISDNFDARVEMTYNAMKRTLSDLDVCIAHDIIAQEYYLPHNAAMRRYAQERPDLLWLHWIHSAPAHGRSASYPQSCRSTPPPGYIVYPNSADIGMVYRTYGLQGKEHKVKVSRSAHALDPLQMWRYDPLTKSLARSADLLGGDVVIIYPARLDRGKQVEKIVRVVVGIKRAGYEPRLLVCDWQSSGEHFQKYIDELLSLARSYGVNDMVHFSSRLNDSCSQGVPPHVVDELLTLSNVGIFPSRTETYSIIVHKAIERGLLVVLNNSLPMMRELYGDAGIYVDFGSDRIDNLVYSPNEQEFFDEEAKRIMGELHNNRALWSQTVARRQWSPDALWTDFERLLYLEPEGE